jgi:hypothetical protein
MEDLLMRAKHLFVAAMVAGCGVTWLNGGGSRSLGGHTGEFSGEPPCQARRTATGELGRPSNLGPKRKLPKRGQPL